MKIGERKRILLYSNALKYDKDLARIQKNKIPYRLFCKTILIVLFRTRKGETNQPHLFNSSLTYNFWGREIQVVTVTEIFT